MRCLAVISSLLFSLATTAYAQSGDYFVYAGSYTNPTPTTTSASKGIYAWRFDSKTGALTPIGLVAETVNPAHVWGHPNGKFLYVNHETDSKVSVFEVNGASLKQIQTLSTLPADHKGNNTTAEIQIDQTGKWLYVTNRGHDSIAHYAVDAAKGTLTLVGHTPSGGRTPRNIAIDPTNRYLIAANQNGDNIVVFGIDQKTGALTPTGATGQVPQPGGVYFVKAQ